MTKKIICYGDSNTWGADPVTGNRLDENTRWTRHLARLLGDGYEIIEEGQCGRTTVWDDPIEDRLSGLTYLPACMDSHHPFDLIIIMLGTNDLKPYFNATAHAIARGAARLVKRAQQSDFGINGQPPKVLFVAPVQVGAHVLQTQEMSQYFDEQAYQRSLLLGTAFEKCAQELHCPFLDAGKIVPPSTCDAIHIDAQYQLPLAQAMAQKVQELLA